jgi:arginyl-tRNA synthetase
LEKDYRKVEQLEEQGKDAEATSLFEKLFSATGLSRDEVARTVDQGREVAVAARSETAKLHSGDPENRRLWEQFMPHCLAALQTIYDRLGIAFDVSLGESFYDPMLPAVAADLEAKGLAVPSEGALVIFTESTNAPMMVRKRDGAYTYATSDLAKVRYCEDQFKADRLLYVVDSRQGDHFKQVFEAARKWGYDQVDFQHIAFGTVMGADRRPYKTRDGDVVGLESLLDEAVAEARKVVDENSPDLDEVERAKVAEIVGLGAIKYADLSQNRLSDYVFDLKKMVAMTGNTATYLQYAYARIQSIIRKAETTPEAVRAANSPIVLGMPAERDLAVQIVRLPEMLDHVASELRPNILADYLFGVANAFSGFYENCPVLKAPTPESRQSRLALCDLTARTLRRGLELLGIGVVERM